ncbi:MAG: hypothetical protein JW715_07850 [Sedimentisphaerales bacterium]|nr:hypothetical protein [Sedimentisphaerales bacterium]
MMKTVSIIVYISLITASISADKIPSAKEILQEYTEGQEKFKSFILKFDCEYAGTIKLPHIGREGSSKGGYIGEFRSDGKRHLFLRKVWGNARPDLAQTKDMVEKDPRYSCEMWNGENRYQYQRSKEEADRDKVYLVNAEDYKPEIDSLGKAEYVNKLWGVLEDTYTRIPYKRVDAELKNADTIFVLPQTEEINGSQCYVLNAATKDSKYKIWIDPQHGYNIARATVLRGEECPNFGKPEEISVSGYIRNVKFKKFGETWVPIEGYYGFNRKVIQNGFEKEDCHIRITHFELNPDHDTLGSFEPNFIRNGSPVQIIGLRGISYIWQDGKVLDSNGKIIVDCTKRTHERENNDAKK